MGIPEPVRGIVWKLLAECEEDEKNSNVKYEDILQSDKVSQFSDVIMRDLHRTMPNHALFEEKAQGFVPLFYQLIIHYCNIIHTFIILLHLSFL